MNVVQLIGQLYDPDAEMRIYYEGSKEIPKVNFTLCCDRPKARGAHLSFVGCVLGGPSAVWFINNVTHGDIVALDGFIDSRIIHFVSGKRERAELRVVITHINWVGHRRTKQILPGSEALNLGDVGVEKQPVDLRGTITNVDVAEEDDNGQYDTLPDWGGVK